MKEENNNENYLRLINWRKIKNTSFSLKNDEEVINEIRDLSKHATSFYKYMFGPVERFSCSLRSDMRLHEEKKIDVYIEIWTYLLQKKLAKILIRYKRKGTKSSLNS